MALLVSDDFTTITSHDSVIGTFGVGGVKPPSVVDTTIKVQGLASVRSKLVSLGIGGTGFDAGSTDVSADHIFLWVRTLDVVTKSDAAGWRIRLSSATGGSSNYKDITVGGRDNDRVRVSGFSHFVCNPHRSGENIAGTPPATTAVVSFAAIADHQSNSQRETWFVDMIKRGTGITVTAGTVGVPGDSDAIAVQDEGNGRGTFKDINGVFYLVGRITLGDIVAASVSHFTDTLRTWLFEDLPVSNIFHKIEFVGGTGTNVVTFGQLVGSGLTAVGVGGNTFLSARNTSAPFNIVCTDPDVVVNLYGCQFINSLYADHSRQAWVEDNSAATFTDKTRDANVIAVTSLVFPAAEGNDDAFYLGDAARGFFGAEYTGSIFPTASAIVVYEYYNGTAWTALKSVVDGTEVAGGAFRQTGVVTWSKPGDWAPVSVNAVIAFYARVRIVSGTFTLDPIFQSFRPLFSGLILFQQANVSAISCLFSGCGPIAIGNGAVLRKCTITDSNAGAFGALDMGTVDPAVDSVRDLQIQNSVTGIHLRPITAQTTYNFRNIVFAGNATDVQVDQNATTEDSYDDTNISGAGRVGNGALFGQAQSFTGAGGVLCRVRVSLERLGTIAGNLVVNIYAHSGTFGTSSIPTGAPLATSEPLDVSTLPTAPAILVDLEFKGAALTLVAATKYVLAVEYVGGDAVNFVFVSRDDSAPTHAGNPATFDGTAWTAITQDMIFFVYTDARTTINVLEGGSTPTIAQVGVPPGTVIVVNAVGVTLTGMANNTEVRVYAAGTFAPELAGIEVATAGADNDRSFTFTLTAGQVIDIRIFAVRREPADILGFTVPTLAVSLPIQQQFDRTYLNP